MPLADRRLPLPTVALVALLGLVPACADTAELTEVSGTAQWLWLHYDDASQEAIHRAVVELNGTVSAVTADEPLMGTMPVLTRADLQPIGLQDVRDPSKTTGLLVVTEIPCKLAQIEKAVIRLDQTQNYPDAYKSYLRKYKTSEADYLARKVLTLAWDVTLTTDPSFGQPATEELAGSVRFVPDLGKDKSPFGAVLLSRTWLKKPASFPVAEFSLPQDYQIEAFYERSAGKIVHLFGVWREGDFDYFDMSSDFLRGQMMEAFADADVEIGELCKSGKL